jgi:hypothetical protein
MESKEYRMHSILFDGANPGGTKKAMHTQRTKPSLQIKKKKKLSVRENVASGP